MNKSNFTQTGGYPLKSERLQEMETAYSIFNSLGALAGNRLLYQDVTARTTLGRWLCFIDGELLAFKRQTST
jgi:hypothetical protein